MDLATVIGIAASFGLMIYAILLGSGLGIFLDIPSLLIVVGGSTGTIFVNYPMKDVLSVINVTKKVFFHKYRSPAEQINLIVAFASRARKEGVLGLENSIRELSDDFLAKGIQMVVDGTNIDVVKELLSKEIEYIAERHKIGADILYSWAAFAPAYGMIGTLIGLVQMLQNMGDPSSIGPAMAVALITTFYGAVLANALFIPMAGKLKKRSKDEILLKELTMEGIVAISAGINPKVIEQKLHAFLSPKMRAGK